MAPPPPVGPAEEAAERLRERALLHRTEQTRTYPCLPLFNDFMQYWLGAFSYVSDGGTDEDGNTVMLFHGPQGILEKRWTDALLTYVATDEGRGVVVDRVVEEVSILDYEISVEYTEDGQNRAAAIGKLKALSATRPERSAAAAGCRPPECPADHREQPARRPSWRGRADRPTAKGRALRAGGA